MVESAFERVSRSNSTERLSPSQWSLGSKSRNHTQMQPSHEHNETQPDARKRRARRQSSMLSATSSLGSQSAKSPSPLDNPSFAPPPPRPIKSKHIMSQFMAEHEPEGKLPSYEKGYQVSRIKPKWYTNGGVLHNFKLDKWYFDGGPTIAGAFASTTHDCIDDLHTIMQEMAKRSPKNKRFMAVIAELAGYGTDHSETEGMSVRSIPQYSTMFSDDIYPTQRQTEEFMGMKSAASC